MPKMDTCLEEFFKSDTDHIIPLVICPLTLERTIPRKTGLLLMLLWPPEPTRTRDSNGPFSSLPRMSHRPPEGKEGGNTTKAGPPRNCYFKHPRPPRHFTLPPICLVGVVAAAHQRTRCPNSTRPRPMSIRSSTAGLVERQAEDSEEFFRSKRLPKEGSGATGHRLALELSGSQAAHGDDR